MRSSWRTFCLQKWEPTRAKTNKRDFWEQDEKQLQKWKILDYIAVPIKWETRSTVARNCSAQDLADDWPVMTYVRLQEKSCDTKTILLQGWKPKTGSDDTGFGRMIVGILEDAEDPTGDISIEDIMKNLPIAARAG